MMNEVQYWWVVAQWVREQEPLYLSSLLLTIVRLVYIHIPATADVKLRITRHWIIFSCESEFSGMFPLS